MLGRPGRIYLVVKDKLAVHVNEQVVVIHVRALAQASGIEADPVVFSRKVELGIRINPVSEKGVACGKEESLPIFHSTHREGVVARLAFEKRLVRLAHAAHGEWPDIGHERADVRQFGDPVLVRIDNSGRRNCCITGRIGIDVHDSESHSPEEIAIPVFNDEREFLHALDVQDKLLRKVILPDAFLVDGLVVGLDDEPDPGIAALAVLRPGYERNLFITTSEPETCIARFLANEGLA